MTNFEVGEVTENHGDDRYEYTFFTPADEPMIRIVFNRVSDEGSGKLFAEWSIAWLLAQPDAEPLVEYERLNLQNSTRRTGGWGTIPDRLLDKGYEADWDTIIQKVVARTIKSFREMATTGVWLEWTESDGKDPYLIRPFLSVKGITLLYGAEGSNKSMVALSLGLSVATGIPFWGATPSRVGPVLFVDFEDDFDPHLLRLTSFARSLGLEPDDIDQKVYHLRITGSLRDAEQEIKDLIRREGIVMVILDSVGLARAGDVSASDVTIKLFKALRFLGVPVLALDHMSKEDKKKVASGSLDPMLATPIGSQFTLSSSRLAWYLQKLPTSTETARRYNMHNTKHNHVPQQASRGLIVRIESDEMDNPITTSFELFDQLFALPKTGESNLTMVVKAFARSDNQPKTPTELGRLTAKNKSSISTVLTGNPDYFTKADKLGTRQFWKLTEEGQAFGDLMGEGGQIE